MKFKAILKKTTSIIATFAVLFNAIAPYSIAVAQEITPTPIPTETSTPTAEPTVSPTTEPTATPVETIAPTVTPEPTIEESATPVPTEEPVINQAPESNPTTTAPPADSNNESNQSLEATASPTAAPQAPKEQGNITTTVIENIDLSEVTTLNSNVDPSPTLTTDQADYSPTSIALITGSGFTKDKTYTLEITSTDEPAVDFVTPVTTDSQGSFTYAYQLDGNYRPNYVVKVFSSSKLIAKVTFTDSVAIIPASGGTGISSNKAQNGSSPAYTTLGNIVIEESVDVDFAANQTNKTLILTAPANWSFNAGTGTVSHQSGRDIDSSSIAVTASTITITFSTDSSANKSDTLTISGIQVRAIDGTVVPSAGNILRTSGNPGTGVIAGITNNSTDFGSLSQVAGSTPTPIPAVGNAATTIDQCQNGGVGNALEPCNESDFPASGGYGYEGNANANQNNSHWNEGDFVPLRIIATNYSAGAGNIQFAIDVTKGGKHAYDYIGDFNATETTGASSATHANHNNPVTDIIPGASATSPDSVGSVPAAALTGFPVACGSNTFTGSQIPGQIKAWGTSGPLTVTYASQNVGSGDCTTTIQVAWTGTQPTFGGTIVIAYGAHIAKQQDWGTGNSAINISGSPYHTSLVQYTTGGETKGIGQQDAKLSAGAVIPPSTITIHKVTSPQGGAGFGFATSGALSPSTFNLNDGQSTSYTSVVPGTYTVSENDPASAGYSLSGLVCGTVTGTGTTATPNVGTRTVSITIGATGGGNVDCTFTNTLQNAHLTLVKNVTNNNGGSALASAWTLSATGPTNISGATGTSNVTNAEVNGGTYTLSESGGPTGYTNGTYSCVKNGGSAVVSNSITLAAGDNATCTVTNDDQSGTLIVKKIVINDNGGTKVASDFTFSVNNATASAFEVDGQNDLTVNAGTYSVTEPSVSGYQTSYDNCSNLVIPNGGSATCTITNNDIAPQLTVIKHVINDNGGVATASAFTMNVTGTNVSDSSFAGSEAGTTVTLDAGSYSVDEDSFAGYAKKIGANCSGTIALGETKTCTITNNDIQPLLTVTKVVTNDNGGTKVVSDFPLFVGLTGVVSGVQNGFNVGNYVVSETNQTGYSATISGDCDAQGNVSLALGQTKSCTITNNDIAPSLTLVKHVQNNDGGNNVATDWVLSATGATSISGSGGATSSATFSAGTYSLSESGPSGYLASSWSCTGGTQDGNSITLGVGQSATCEITNDDIPATITLIKYVDAQYGGDASVNDFGLTIGATGVTSGQVLSVNSNTSYALNEAGLFGYEFVSITGDKLCPNVLNGTVTLTEGQSISCTITNRDIQPKLTVIKHVINDNGGKEVAGAFTMNVTGTNVSDVSFPGDENGTTITLNAGSYSVDEDSFPGYTKTLGTDCSGTISVGEEKTCTITNDDVAPTLKLVKEVNNEDGGEAVAGDWTLTADGGEDGFSDSGDSKDFHTVTANVGYVLSESTGPTDYSQGSWSCDGGELVEGQITLGVAQNVTCTITNTFTARYGLNITKENNTTGTVNAGSTITYTLNVKNDSNVAIANLNVMDFLPGGFHYVAGTTTGSINSDPTIAGNKLTWNVGTVLAGATVSISYQANTDSDLSDGTYFNYATCNALTRKEQSLECNEANSSVTLGHGTSFGGNLVGQVLGASTELPATGSPTGLTLFALGLLGVGLFLKGYNGKRNTKVNTKKPQYVKTARGKKTKKHAKK